MRDASTKPPRLYTLHDRLAVGDRVEHPSFGIGVVVEIAEHARVRFDDGDRILAHAPPRPRVITESDHRE